jgi:membrane-bound lytic murein transglycosylase D
MRRGVLTALFVISAICVGCAPRYTTRSAQSEDAPASSPELDAIIADAGRIYEQGVDLFTEEQYDSARVYLEQAVALLGRDLDWSPYDEALSERRHLLYKCRYFLERIPAVLAEHPPGTALDDIVPLKPELPPVEIVRNDRVEKWIRYFTGDGRNCLSRWVKRSGKYRDGMQAILKEEGMPLELVNLAMIESGFYAQAYSRASAVGFWQFIESTGKIYGLRIDWWVDERKDPEASTRAAARHLRDLYESLDSWPLAFAAYNWGQRRVERAVKRAHSRDYWDLKINRETANYVPKFMAACIIMDAPGDYGFDFEYDSPLVYEDIEVDPKTHLGAVADVCGVDTTHVLELNPHLIRGCAPDGKSFYPVRIPEGMVEVCRAGLAAMPREERIASTFLTPTVKHKVRRGETLSGIASRYGVSISEITSANSIRNRHRIRIGQVLTVPGGDFRGPADRPGIHVVRKNETLSSIAKRYGVRVKDIERWNNLSSRDLIYPGQKLTLEAGQVRDGSGLVHRVSPGETLSEIAGKYEVSLREILAANDLGSDSVIFPDQKIRIPGARAASAGNSLGVYTVKSGDTISGIASRHGVSTDAVLAANDLSRTSRIYPGQELLVPVSAGTGECGVALVHEVRSGESIYSIAKKYSVSCEEVLSLNDLSSNAVIYPGQMIKVSKASSRTPSMKHHKVSSGETITAIARRYGVSASEVLRLNGLGSRDRIYPGQMIKIPAL